MKLQVFCLSGVFCALSTPFGTIGMMCYQENITIYKVNVCDGCFYLMDIEKLHVFKAFINKQITLAFDTEHNGSFSFW